MWLSSTETVKSILQIHFFTIKNFNAIFCCYFSLLRHCFLNESLIPLTKRPKIRKGTPYCITCLHFADTIYHLKIASTVASQIAVFATVTRLLLIWYIPTLAKKQKNCWVALTKSSSYCLAIRAEIQLHTWILFSNIRT